MHPSNQVIDSNLLQGILEEQPHPLLFTSLSGAHLYGFPSTDSDYDLRGVHLLPLGDVIGLRRGEETIQVSTVRDGREIDLVTHDAEKYFRLLLKKNGYVLEQIFSPLMVQTSAAHGRLKRIAARCITRHHAHHYSGFAQNQWRLFSKSDLRRVKPLLYVFRVLLTGIHLMRSGRVEANLVALNDHFRLPFIPDLIARKTSGPELSVLDDSDWEFAARAYEQLLADLEAAYYASTLPEEPEVYDDLHHLLVEIRLASAAN